MISATHYYDLEGCAKTLVDILSKPADMIQECSYSDSPRTIEKIAQTAAKIFLFVPMIIGRSIALLIDTCARQKIDTQIYQQEYEKWDKIIIKGSYQKDLAIDQLIAAKVLSPSPYSKIFIGDSVNGRNLGCFFQSFDGVYKGTGVPEQIANEIRQNKKVLVCGWLAGTHEKRFREWIKTGSSNAHMKNAIVDSIASDSRLDKDHVKAHLDCGVSLGVKFHFPITVSVVE